MVFVSWCNASSLLAGADDERGKTSQSNYGLCDERITCATTKLTSFEMTQARREKRPKVFAPAVRAPWRRSVDDGALKAGIVA